MVIIRTGHRKFTSWKHVWWMLTVKKAQLWAWPGPRTEFWCTYQNSHQKEAVETWWLFLLRFSKEALLLVASSAWYCTLHKFRMFSIPHQGFPWYQRFLRHWKIKSSGCWDVPTAKGACCQDWQSQVWAQFIVGGDNGLLKVLLWSTYLPTHTHTQRPHKNIIVKNIQTIKENHLQSYNWVVRMNDITDWLPRIKNSDGTS